MQDIPPVVAPVEVIMPRLPAAARVANGILTITGDPQGTTEGMARIGGKGQRYGRWEGRVRAPASDLDIVLAVEARQFLCEQDGIAMAPSRPEAALSAIVAEVRATARELDYHGP